MQRIAELLISQYEYDIAVFSNPWLYVFFLIPAMAYLVFFILKWSVLTMPVWLPLAKIAQSLSSTKDR
jgi:hypothetical protein